MCQNLEVSGMAFGTERKTSGELPAAVKKTKKEKARDKDDGKTTLLIKERQKDALEQSKKIVSSMFESLNPQNFLDNALKQLQTPAASQKAQETVAQIVATWEKRPLLVVRRFPIMCGGFSLGSFPRCRPGYMWGLFPRWCWIIFGPGLMALSR